MKRFTPVRLIRNEFELDDLIRSSGNDRRLIEQDFALMTIASALATVYRDSLCFKGGFVLRHAHGHTRFSRDIDATRINPPGHKLDRTEVAGVIQGAGMPNLLTLKPDDPTTDSGRSLDFDRIRYMAPTGGGQVSVELSYREDVIEEPVLAEVGPPYFEPFPIPVMSIHEIAAEKLRTLAQRVRPTDLADLAMVLAAHPIDDARVRALASEKFKLVKQGDQALRIKRNVETMSAGYGAAVRAVAPDAPDFETASKTVLKRLSLLLP